MRSLSSFFLAAILVFISQSFSVPSFAQSSSNSGKIAFVSGGGDIYVINADGTGQTRLTNNGFNHTFPSWSPDGSQIAFVSTRFQGSQNIFRMNADGSSQIQLTTSVYPGFSNYPAWSPDGSKIAFTRAIGTDSKSEVWVMKADGTELSKLTTSQPEPANPNLPVLSYVRHPSWSPDGKKLAFSSFDNGKPGSEIFVMNVDGSNLVKLTENSVEDVDPRWSPDGQKIAFASHRTGNIEVFVMNADGSNQTNLTNFPSTNDFQPVWSPDGTKIVFGRVVSGKSQLFLMNSDGSNQTQLTTNTTDSLSPAWQPLSGPAPPPPPPPPTYSVSGRVTDSSMGSPFEPSPGIGGVTLTLTGAVSVTTQTDANGNYFIGNLPESSTFTLTPALGGWSFYPTSQTFKTDPFSPNFNNRNLTLFFSGAPIYVQFQNAEFSEFEGRSASIRVTRGGFITGAASVSYSTSDGMAQAGVDYIHTSGRLNFAPGESSKTFTIPLIYDASAESRETINLTLSNPEGAIFRGNTTAVLTVSDPLPVLLTDSTDGRALAVNAVTFVRDPFALVTRNNLGSDEATRVILFARYIDLAQGETASVVTAQAFDSQSISYQLPVESLARVPGFDWLTQVVVKLPENLPAGNLWVSIKLRGNESNRVLIRIN